MKNKETVKTGSREAEEQEVGREANTHDSKKKSRIVE